MTRRRRTRAPRRILLSGEEQRRCAHQAGARGAWLEHDHAVRTPERRPASTMNPSAVWRIENGKRRINLDEAIGFAEVFGIDLRQPRRPSAARRAGPGHGTHRQRRRHAQQATQRAQHAFAQARDSFDAYIAEHPDIREEAELMVSNAIAESVMKMNAEIFGPPPGASAEADHSVAPSDE